MSTPLSKSANQFAVDLFQCYLNRHGDKYKNLLLCPYLIYHSLAMMLVGAKGHTAQQLYKLLRIPSNNRRSRSVSPIRSNLSSSRSSSISSSHGTRSPSGRALVRCTRTRDKSRSPSTSSVSSSGTSTSVDLDYINTRTEKSGSKSRRQLTPDGPDEARHREFLLLTEQLIHGNHDFVHLASFIYLDKGTKRTERYKAILRDYYETKPKKIDFDNVDLMVKTVNEDVKRTTENIYNDILSKQEAQKLEKSYMLLVNAVFFRGFWSSNFTDVKKAPFFQYSITGLDQMISQSASKGKSSNQQQQQDSNKTTPSAESASPVSPTLSSSSSSTNPIDQQQQQQLSGKLAAAANTSQQQSSASKQPQALKLLQHEINMMSKLDYLPVLADELLDARIIKMPFEASDLQMLIILPNNRQSDSTYLCEKMTASKINHIVQQFSSAKSRTVRVSMPIFCIDSGKISIQSTLVTMGAGDLFDKSKANLSGVCENKQIWLHKILHRCFIICDNRGAITSSNFEKARRRQAKIESGMTTGRSGVEEFVVDHPFMYIIMDSVTKTILIIGLYTDPTETIEVIHENQLSPEEAHQIYTEGMYKT